MPAAATAAISIFGVAAIAGVIIFAARARVLPGPSLVGKTVVVNTRRPDDQSVRGVLVAQHADRLILRDAVFLHKTGSIDAGGFIHMPLLGISTVQEIVVPVEPAETTQPVLAP